ncbi:MAG TPA: isoamylase early set domain-containing protein [Gemmatimonadaceae bacterium]|nr:isoamylase early set domain-containing protein [Gemmatimonadaceae bacterium]
MADHHGTDTGSDAAFAARVAAPLRAAERLEPGFRERVMRQVRREGVPGVTALPVAVRPRRGAPRWLTGAGLAAAALAGVLLGRAAPPRAPTAASVARPDTVYVVKFVIAAPAAGTVALVGDFNAWDKQATPLRPTSQPGIWSVSLPLAPGRHEYAFIVDGGEWRADPAATRVLDDFGTESSIVTVGPAEVMRAT